MKQLFEKISQFLTDRSDQQKRKYIIVAALTGILLILLSNIFAPKKDPLAVEQVPLTEAASQTEITEPLQINVEEIEADYAKKLQKMLTQIKDISEVEVMINLDASNMHVYEKDVISSKQTTEEIDSNGGNRQVEDETKEAKLVYVREGDQEVPVLIQTKKPVVRGVFIIAKGADQPSTKKAIIESVSRVLDVPTYRISVMAK